MRLLSILLLSLFWSCVAAHPTYSKEKLELLLEEEVLIERMRQEIENAIENEETKIKRRELHGEESMMNFLNDYRKRFSFGPAAAGSQFRPGR